MKFRDGVVVVHRWMSLGAGGFWVIASLTGAVLVFGPEIDRALNAGRFDVSAQAPAPGVLDRALAEQFPDASVLAIRWLDLEDVVRVDYERGGQRGHAFLDAGTGNRVEATRPRRELVAAVQRLHVTLLAGRIGTRIVTLASAVTALSMLVGILLWWPGIRTFGRGFIVRLNRGAYVLNFDLHKCLGAAAAVLLILMTGTGAVLGSPRVSARLSVILFPGEDPPPIPAVPLPAAGAPVPGPEALIAAATSTVSGEVMALEFPARMPDRVLARIRTDPARVETTQVYLARSDARVLSVRPPEADGSRERFGQFNMRLHTGRFPSVLVRVLYAVACIVGGVLAVTGLVVWWMKRSKLESARRRAGAAAVA